MPAFAIWPFFVAGALCALGPVIIHLLNRRRFRVVHWAAMDFLKQAMQRNRRILQLRDLILLALRTLAVLLFGVALAQPSCRSIEDSAGRNQPVHAVLLVDNSLSMGYGYQSLEGTILDRARQRGQEFIEALPAGSRISVVPLCGVREGYSLEPYASRDAAIAALKQIEVVDRAAKFDDALNLAHQACDSHPELGKRLVLFTDQQRSMFDGKTAVDLSGLPATLQVVNVAPEAVRSNTWISSLRLQDGIADTLSPATIVAEVRHVGSEAVRNCEVRLLVGGEVVSAQTKTIESGGAVEVVFKHAFVGVMPTPGQPVFVPVQVTVADGEGTPDRLPADNSRFLMAPVMAGLPIVFVDQYAGIENPLQNKTGETRLLRRQLAPVIRGEDPAQQLVKVRYLSSDKLLGAEGRKQLADVRLVVVAGLADPSDIVENLRQYVEQGGQLLIAAGGQFDPVAWNTNGWKDGRGILPAPLDKELVGKIPGERDKEVKFFRLAYAKSMKNRALFNLAGEPETFLDEMYSASIFFQAVKVDLGDKTQESFVASERKRLEEQDARRTELRDALEKLRTKQRAGKLTADDEAEQKKLDEQRKQLEPDWLAWRAAEENPLDSLTGKPEERAQRIADLAQRARPDVLARFDRPDGLPFLVERQMGRGKVTFCASGLYPEWNTMATTSTAILWDRVVRLALESTLPSRSFSVADRLPIPLPQIDRNDRFTLIRPGEKPEQAEAIDVTFIGRESRGATIEHPFTRGIYRIHRLASSDEAPASTAAATSAADVELAVNGDPSESELTELTTAEAERVASAEKLHWLAGRDPISLEGEILRGQYAWWWIAATVLALLLVELAILAWPVWQSRTATGEPKTSTGSPQVYSSPRSAERETAGV